MNVQVSLTNAQRLAAQGRWPEVRACLLGLDDRIELRRDIQLLLAQAEFALGDASGGIDRLNALRALTPDDSALCFEAAAMAFDAGRWDEVEHHAGHCAQLEPTHFGAWLLRGLALGELGRTEASLGALLRAVRLAERVDPRQLPPAFRSGLVEASRRVRKRLSDVLDAALRPVESQYGEASVRRLRKGAEIFAGAKPAEFAHPLWRPGLFYIPDLSPRMFFEREEFPWVATVEAGWHDVRDELLNCLSAGDAENQGFAPYVDHEAGSHEAKAWSDINRSKRWSALHFFRHGQRLDATHDRCPKTSAVLDEVDLQRIPGYGPEVMFSLLHPKTRIPAHYGSVNGRVIAHLPLIVPPACGGIRVGSETRTWHEGRILAFDDSFEHEAWNESDSPRTVLIFDTWHPALDQGERQAMAAVLVAVQGFESQLLAGVDTSQGAA